MREGRGGGVLFNRVLKEDEKHARAAPGTHRTLLVRSLLRLRLLLLRLLLLRFLFLGGHGEEHIQASVEL